MTMLLKIAIIEVAQAEFGIVVDEVIGAKNWSRDVADVEANIHVDVANDDVNVFVAMHLDVVAICSWTLAPKRLQLDLRNKVDGRDWWQGACVSDLVLGRPG